MSAAKRLAERCAAVALGLMLAAARSSHAQAVSGSLGGADLSRLVSYHGYVLEQECICGAASGALRAGPLRLAVDGTIGTLAAGAGGLPNADVGYRATAATLQLAVNRELFVGLRREGRRFRADAGDTYWLLRGWDVRFEPDFGLPGLRGVADVAFLTSSAVRGGARFSKALQTAMGVSYRPGGGPIEVRVAYRFERYDMARAPTDASPRYEEFRGMVVEVGVRPVH